VKKFISHVMIPIALIMSAVFMAAVMFMLRQPAVRVDLEPPVMPVEVLVAVSDTRPAELDVGGQVTAARQASLIPQVSGQVTWISKVFEPGARVSRGETLLRIQPEDYELQVVQQQRTVEDARLAYAMEQERQKLAAKNWETLGDGGTASDLTLRKPHLVASQKGLAAAEAGLRQAELALERTWIRAPFDAVVTAKQADVGQVVGPGAPVAQVIGVDEVWVQATVPVEALAQVDVPGFRGATAGSSARVVQHVGATERIVRDGSVTRLFGQIDAATRTATLLVEIPAPLGEEGLPLLPGAWVDVTITGRSLAQTFEIPRTAIYEGRTVYVVKDGKLSPRDVTIGWRHDETVIVTGGLASGDQVVTTPMSIPIDGMPVRLASDGVTEADQ
jgi:RND family efflux transporter MFP subunit